MLDSIKETGKERISSPIFGPFIFSWLAWNWKVVYLSIFSDTNNLKYSKLYYVEKMYSIEYFFWYPLWSTSLIIIVFPFAGAAANVIGEFALKLQNDFKGHFLKLNYVEVSKLNELKSEIEKLETKSENIKNINRLLENDLNNRNKELDHEKENIIKIKTELYSTSEKYQNLIYDLQQRDAFDLENPRKIETLFQGPWIKESYSIGKAEFGDDLEALIFENAIKVENNHYYLDNILLTIDMAYIDLKNKEFMFRTIGPENDKTIHELHIIEEGKYYEGFENEKIKVRYRKGERIFSPS